MQKIRKVAVLGSGIMGSGIACHLANAGFQVLMLDLLPKELNGDGNSTGVDRNRVANQALREAVKSKPAPLFKKEYIERITTGNFTDDFPKIDNCDWIIEVVVERLDVKKQIFEQVEEHRRQDSFVSSNTSGIPIHMMADSRSENFKHHFLGTHFFNPPRYLRLLEIIPTEETKPEVVDFFMEFGKRFLGKETVLSNDTPAFIGNRIGVYTMAQIFELTEELGLTIDEVDKLTGPGLARPKTGTFRLTDLVGLDTAMRVINGIKENVKQDPQVQRLEEPRFLSYLMENEYYGNKSGRGFYHKTDQKDKQGGTVIEALNLLTLEYEPTKKSDLESLKVSRQTEKADKRISSLFDHEDKGGQLVRRSLASLFAYSSQRVGEVTEYIYSIDNALKAGFAWEYGPFEYWDIIGLENGIEAAKDEGYEVAEWVNKMVDEGKEHFYVVEEGTKKFYDHSSGDYRPVPGAEEVIILKNYQNREPVFKNDEVTLHDTGDGVLVLEFMSMRNTIGEGILRGIQESITIAEEDGWKGIVIGNNDNNFSVGANLMLIGMMAMQQDFDQLNQAVSLFQNTTMKCRYARIPVVAAVQGYVFGGGCEISMHCDAVVAAAESYIGLVEAGVGLIPGGGGTKEFALRASDAFFEGDVQIPTLLEKATTLAQARVSTSADEAFDHGYLMEEKDHRVMNVDYNIGEAREKVLELAEDYVVPIPREDVIVLGRTGLGALYGAIHSMQLSNIASEHDALIARKLAWVLCGGDLTGVHQVSERYLLDLEREAFLSLCGEQKTLQRIQHMLEKNKPLRN